MMLQDSLYKLRSDTKDAFDEAKALEARWKELEKEQREVYQASSYPIAMITLELIPSLALFTTIPTYAPQAQHYSSRRCIRSTGIIFRPTTTS